MIKLSFPLVLNKLSFMVIVLTDTVMMGWLGPKALAAGSLAGYFFGLVILFSVGLLSASTPIFAHHLGAGRFGNIRRTFRQSVWLAVLLSLPSMVLVWNCGTVLVFLGQDAELALAGQSYVRFLVLGFLPSILRLIFSFLLAAHSRPRANFVITMIGIGINFVGNYALMFGHFGFPKLGLVGAGISSTLVMCVSSLCMLGFILMDRRMRRYCLFGRFWRSDWPQFVEIVRVGLPIAVTEMAKMSLFFAAILFMGLLGTEAVSAHVIAIQSCAVFVMVAVGIGQAATVRVGYFLGAMDPLSAKRVGWVCLGLGSVFSLIPAVTFLFFGIEIVRIYLDVSDPQNTRTVKLALSLLIIAALFQIVDFIQVVAGCILQGLKDTRWPMYIALGSYWGLGIPLMAIFSFLFEMGGQSIWMSLVVALAVIASLLVQRLRGQFRTLI